MVVVAGVVVVVVEGGAVVTVVVVIMVVVVVEPGGNVELVVDVLGIVVLVVVTGGRHENSKIPSIDETPRPVAKSFSGTDNTTVNVAPNKTGSPTVTAPGPRSTSANTDTAPSDITNTSLPGCVDASLDMVSVGTHTACSGDAVSAMMT